MAMAFENKITVGQCIQIVTTLGGLVGLYLGLLTSLNDNVNAVSKIDGRVKVLEDAKLESARISREDMKEIRTQIERLTSNVAIVSVAVARVEGAVSGTHSKPKTIP